MKKHVTLLLTVLLLAAMSVPSFAALNTHIGGKVNAHLWYHNEDGVVARGLSEVNIGLSAGNEGNLRAVVNLDAWEAKSGRQDFYDNPYNHHQDVTLRVSSAYIESTGSWFKGMAPTVTKVGRFETNYSDWVAKFRSLNGLEVAGIDLDILSIDVLAARTGDGDRAWYGDDTTHRHARVFGVRTNVDLEVVNLDITAVHTTPESSADIPVRDDAHLDFAVVANLDPVEDLSLTGEFALDGNAQESAFRVGGNFSGIDNFSFDASVWATPADFHPVWSARKDNDWHKEPAKYEQDEKGFKVGANTTQSGIDLGGSFESTTNFAGANRKNVIVGSAASNGTLIDNTDLSLKVTSDSTESNPKIEASVFHTLRGDFDVKLGYELVREHDATMKHTLSADTTVDTIIADGINLRGLVRLQDNKDAEFAAAATWQAPNGFNIGLHYANFDRAHDKDLLPGVHYHAPAGFAVYTGVEVGF